MKRIAPRRLRESRFWETVGLADMTNEQWEALCDGCGKCCLYKLQDIDTDEIVFTNVACRLLDCHSCRCSDYPNRFEKVEDCISLGPENVGELQWLPSTCAYRLLDEGGELPEWHPLITGDANSVHRAGISVRGRVVTEDEADADLENHVLDGEP
ncbi:MAG: YcgN family cysteine cluster protein [Minwuia sp.]|uniref:YcgN family cysteine cluster protein n=1 Tax=Minwuia sp. TaxID=2493630 RepID=UPI003A8A697A